CALTRSWSSSTLRPMSVPSNPRSSSTSPSSP
ncbi:MAG: SSU ribosomal protein S6p, partial [uncultured Friedmanniella sp.]